MNKATRSQSKYIYWISCTLFAVVFLLVMGENGPILENDSPTFINPTEYIKKSYFLYTSFLGICRLIFGDSIYLYLVFLFQSLFAFVASFALTEYLRKQFDLKYISAFVVYICTFLPYAYSLPESVANHHVLTEAIAYPLFTLYMLFVFKTFLNKKHIWMIAVGVMTVLIILSRSQLLLLLPVYFLLWVIIGLQAVYVRIGEGKKKNFWSTLSISIIGVGVAGLIMVVNLIGNNSISQLAQLTTAVSGRVLCVIDKEDRELFTGDEQGAFDLVFLKVDESKQRYPYFREGVWKWEDIANCTNLNTNIYYATVDEYYQKSGGEYSQDMIDMTANRIISRLFVYHLDDYFYMTLHLLAQSFVVAVFIHPSVIITLCYIIAALIYLMAIVLLWYAHRKEVPKEYGIPLWLTLLLLAANVVITNLIFYGLQRYVVYTFGCFYLSVFILLIGIYRTNTREEIKSTE